MTRFPALLHLEIRLFVRQGLTWSMYLALAVAMLWGAHNAARARNRQAMVVSSLARQERAADRAARMTADRYARPLPFDLPWWKDPTDAFAYMTDYLKRYAVKPPTPLAALAVGQSDLLPYYIEIKPMAAPSEDVAYDVGNPRAMGLGSFDLAFVLVHLLPLALIVLSVFRLSGEQDSGVLRLIAAQPVSPRAVAATKFGAVAVVSVTVVPALLGLALVTTGLPPLAPAWAGVLAMAGAALVAYILFWIALSALVVSLWRGAVASAVIAIGGWAVFTALIPALAALLLQTFWPTPSRLAFTDMSRRMTDAAAASPDLAVATYLAAHPIYANADPGFGKSRELSKIAAQFALERRLDHADRPFAVARAAEMGAADTLRFLSPALMFDQLLQSTAGTDIRRHLAFVDQSRAYRERLRALLWPQALRQAAWPHPASCAPCAARMAFDGFDRTPFHRYRFDMAALLYRVATALLYLWLIAVLAVILATLRFGRWANNIRAETQSEPEGDRGCDGDA